MKSKKAKIHPVFTPYAAISFGILVCMFFSSVNAPRTHVKADIKDSKYERVFAHIINWM